MRPLSTPVLEVRVDYLYKYEIKYPKASEVYDFAVWFANTDGGICNYAKAQRRKELRPVLNRYFSI